METRELIKALRICGKQNGKCDGCIYSEDAPTCYSKLKLLAAKELEHLLTENEYLKAKVKE